MLERTRLKIRPPFGFFCLKDADVPKKRAQVICGDPNHQRNELLTRSASTVIFSADALRCPITSQNA